MKNAERRAAFADAFYRQAVSDWGVYELLAATANMPACHALHYLQMACEKLAKADRLRDTESDLNELLSKHTGFTKFINSFLRSPRLMREYVGQAARHRHVCANASKLAREVEKLAPSIDQSTSPENAEYPWEHGDKVLLPCEYGYPALSLLSATGGRAFLKLIGRALRDYEQIEIG
jgi:hypothetical protein